MSAIDFKKKKKNRSKINFGTLEKDSEDDFKPFMTTKKNKIKKIRIKVNKEVEKQVKAFCEQYFKDAKEEREKKSLEEDEKNQPKKTPFLYSSAKPEEEKPKEEKKEIKSIHDDDNEDHKEYKNLVTRIFDIIKEKNPQLSGRVTQFKMKPPQIGREPRKTVVVNYGEICKTLKRDSDHLKSFIFSELETHGSLDGNNRLIIRGIFYQKHIQNVLRKYINKYLKCANCGGFDTTLSKDTATRLYNLVCLNCEATRTVTRHVQRT